MPFSHFISAEAVVSAASCAAAAPDTTKLAPGSVWKVPDATRDGQHRGLVGNIEQQRDDIRAELAPETIGIGLLAHSAEHAESAAEQ